MHAAPPVRVSVGRSRGWALFAGACVAAALGNAALWVLLHAQVAAAGLLAAVLALAAGLGAAWQFGRGAEGDLAWDGRSWLWRGQAVAVEVALDLDRWLLVRAGPPGARRRWLALSRGSAAGDWAALRAALYSRGPGDPLDPMQAPPA